MPTPTFTYEGRVIELLQEIASGSTGGPGSGGATDAKLDEIKAQFTALLSENATEIEQQQLEALVSSFLAENATEAKQDAIIAKNEQVRSLLNDLKSAIAILNGDGAIQAPQEKVATKDFSLAIAAGATRKKVKITNLSKTDILYFCFGTTDAGLLNSSALLPLQTYTSDTLAEARARMTVVTEDNPTTPITVNYSLQTII